MPAPSCCTFALCTRKARAGSDRCTAHTHAPRWTLDGVPVEIVSVLMDPMLDEETRGLALSLAPGEEMNLGGGAFADALLRRES